MFGKKSENKPSGRIDSLIGAGTRVEGSIRFAGGLRIDGEVVAFDRFTGDQLWKNDDLKYRGLTNPVTIGQHIAVGDKQGVIHVLNASGQIISRVSTKGELTSLSVVNNRLYAQSTDGIVSIYQF